MQHRINLTIRAGFKPANSVSNGDGMCVRSTPIGHCGMMGIEPMPATLLPTYGPTPRGHHRFFGIAFRCSTTELHSSYQGLPDMHLTASRLPSKYAWGDLNSQSRRHQFLRLTCIPNSTTDAWSLCRLYRTCCTTFVTSILAAPFFPDVSSAFRTLAQMCSFVC